MLVLAIALLAGLAVGVAASFVDFLGIIGAILPALAVAIVTYVVLMRRTNVELQAAMMGVQSAIQRRNVDEAIVILEAIKRRFSRWAFFLGAQIDGQIGSIHFMKREFDKARTYLDRSFVRNWDARLMLAVLVSGALDKKKKGDLAQADAILEKAARYSPKQGLLWSTWAWLHWNADDEKKAIEILNRGKQALGESDPHLTHNLLALQNDKKMKMKGYGDPWYALHLEQHPMVMQAQRGGVRFARR